MRLIFALHIELFYIFLCQCEVLDFYISERIYHGHLFFLQLHRPTTLVRFVLSAFT